MTPDEKRAVVLYAVLDRDPSDFIDMLREPKTTGECLETLHLMFVTPNEKHDSRTRRLNEIGADMVEREMERRKDG